VQSKRYEDGWAGSQTFLFFSGFFFLCLPLGETTRPLPFLAPLYTVSTISMNSCLSFIAQLILLLLPVPRSTMICCKTQNKEKTGFFGVSKQVHCLKNEYFPSLSMGCRLSEMCIKDQTTLSCDNLQRKSPIVPATSQRHVKFFHQ
jgi:hypothetical protein